jgi:hypothetical protein
VKVIPNTFPLYDGLYLKAEIPGESIAESMEIPRNAVINQNQVFIVEDSLLKVKEIDVKKVNPKTVIFSGLTEGADLVIEPLLNAHNNMIAWKEEDRSLHEKEEAQRLTRDSTDDPEIVTTSN